MTEPISYEDFQKLDIRTAKIESATRIEGTDKLLRLEVDTGIDKRTLVAGIADAYPPEELIGKSIIVLANLEPKAIRGVESKGMLLAADEGSKPILLTPDRDVTPGARIR